MNSVTVNFVNHNDEIKYTRSVRVTAAKRVSELARLTGAGYYLLITSETIYNKSDAIFQYEL